MRARVVFDLNIPISIEEQTAEHCGSDFGESDLIEMSYGWIADMLSEGFSSPTIHQQTASFYGHPADSPFRILGNSVEQFAKDETCVRIVSIAKTAEEISDAPPKIGG